MQLLVVLKNADSNLASEIIIHISTVLKAGAGFRLFLLAVLWKESGVCAPRLRLNERGPLGKITAVLQTGHSSLQT